MPRNQSPSSRPLAYEEQVTVAYLYYVRKLSQQDLATAYNVNSGRISEACTAVHRALTAEQVDD